MFSCCMFCDTMCGTWYRRATLLRWSSGSGVVVRGVEGEMVVVWYATLFYSVYSK